MNWTGGKLKRETRKGGKSTLTEKQKQHFAKARSKQANLQTIPAPSRPSFWLERSEAADRDDARSIGSDGRQRLLEEFEGIDPIVRRLNSMQNRPVRSTPFYRRRDIRHLDKGLRKDHIRRHPEKVYLAGKGRSWVDGCASDDRISKDEVHKSGVIDQRNDTSELARCTGSESLDKNLEDKQRRSVMQRDWLGIDAQLPSSSSQKRKADHIAQTNSRAAKPWKRVKSPIFHKNYMMTNAVAPDDERVSVKIGDDVSLSHFNTSRSARATRIASSPLICTTGSPTHHADSSPASVVGGHEMESLYEGKLEVECSQVPSRSISSYPLMDGRTNQSSDGMKSLASRGNILNGSALDPDILDCLSSSRSVAHIPSTTLLTKRDTSKPTGIDLTRLDQEEEARGDASARRDAFDENPRPWKPSVAGRSPIREMFYHGVEHPAPNDSFHGEKPAVSRGATIAKVHVGPPQLTELINNEGYIRNTSPLQRANELWKDFVFGFSSPSASSGFRDNRAHHVATSSLSMAVNPSRTPDRSTKQHNHSGLHDSDIYIAKTTGCSNGVESPAFNKCAPLSSEMETNSSFSLDRPSSVADASVAPAILYDRSSRNSGPPLSLQQLKLHYPSRVQLQQTFHELKNTSETAPQSSLPDPRTYQPAPGRQKTDVPAKTSNPPVTPNGYKKTGTRHQRQAVLLPMRRPRPSAGPVYSPQAWNRT